VVVAAPGPERRCDQFGPGDDQRDLQVGSDVVLDINDREATWRVVGIVVPIRPAVYIPDDYACTR
jgi:hypothetical protein